MSSYDLLIAGSNAYNEDTKKIKHLVSLLQGLLKKFSDELPANFHFTADLYRESESTPAWGVEFRLFCKGARAEEVVLVLNRVVGHAQGQIPWKEIQWSPFGRDMPLFIAAHLAGNLDSVINSALDALKAVSAFGARNAINSLIERGEQVH